MSVLFFHGMEVTLRLMKRLFSIVLFCAFCVAVGAQEVDDRVELKDTSAVVGMPVDQRIIGGTDAPTDIYVYDGYRGEPLAEADSLHLPVLNRYGQTYINMYPYSWMGWYDWQLHKGLNVSLGASVFASFGDGPWSGTGFTNSISGMYAVPLTNKISLAVGGYLNNLYWAHDAYHDAGLNAVLGYKFNEHWEGYLFGQKSLTNKFIPLPLYDMSNAGDRIGAAVKYNFNPKFSIQVTVSAERR